MSATIQATLVVNGARHGVAADGSRSLLDILRNELGLKGSRFGCGQGECGACMVLLDGQAVPACDTPLWSADGKDVLTVEGLGAHPVGMRLQQEFVREQAAQCGYCTAGLLVAATGLLAGRPDADEARIRDELDRNLCRCGAHGRVVRAVRKVAVSLAGAPAGQADGGASTAVAS